MADDIKPTASQAAGTAIEEAAPPKDPRIAAGEAVLEVVQFRITSRFGSEVIEEAKLAKFQPSILIQKEQWANVIEYLKNDEALRFDYVECMVGTDYPAQEYIEVVIYVYSTKHQYYICAKVRTDRTQPQIPSITPVYRGVNWEEREIYDLLGVEFTGHPDMRR